MNTYLITGGSGFVGSRLTGALLARGDSVMILDNLSTGRLDNLRPHPDLRFWLPDTAKLRALTGWAPRRSLEEILAEVVREARDDLVSSR